MRPMRDVQRRRLLQQTRARVVPEAAAKIHKSLDQRFKALKRELRRGNLRKRIKKSMSDATNGAVEKWSSFNEFGQARIINEALYKQEDDGSWQEWIDQFDQQVREALTFVVGGMWSSESRYWETRNASPNPVDPQKIISDYEARTGRQIKNIGQDTKQGVLDAISDWYNTDASLPELIDDLGQWFDENRAEVIARTETSYIEAEVSSNMYDQFGVEFFNVDRDPNIGPACDECQVMIDGNPHPMDDPMPPYHPNCLDGTVPASSDGSEFMFGGEQ